MIFPYLQLKNVKKSFDHKVVLQDLTLEIKSQESLVVIGASGTGKSVMLKCILGLLPVDHGSILLNGQEIVGASRKELENIRQKTSMVFQGSALFDSLPIWENIIFKLLQQNQITRTVGKELAIEKLKDVGLSPDIANLQPSELSGGMQRRVALARAIVSKPEFLLFDEPTTGLDPVLAKVINTLIRSSIKNLKATAITITHDMTSARYIGDTVAMLDQGQIIWKGSTSQLDHIDNIKVREFIHAPQTSNS